MSWIVAVLVAAGETFLVAAPWLLFGLVAAGFMHLLLPRRHIHRWMGGNGLGSVTRAALFGVPMPVCSCGVIPLSLTVRDKGASRPATMSFLITTPESGPDSIAITWGMMGPVMAIARPVSSLITAWIAGVVYALFPDRAAASSFPGPAAPGPEATTSDDDAPSCCSSADALPADEPVDPDVTLGQFGRALVGRRREDEPGFGTLLARAGRFAFVKLLDDIAFWLVIGVLVTGIVSVLLPDDLSRYGLGGGLLPMVLILVASIPLYVCASASTPVAAALIAKGLSPGAALVFLLAGPATNAASLVVLGRNFGKRFMRIYLAAIVLGSLACGLAFDALIGATGIRIVARIGHVHAGGSWVEWTAASVLGVLLLWRFRHGAAQDGWHELSRSLRALLPGGRPGGEAAG